MSIKEDVLRALEYGKSAYYQAIQAIPSYQSELSRVRTDYNERTWIDFSGFFPKFTTEEFERRRQQYQAKYGNSINIPGFSDIIHIIPKATISAEERAAHLWANKRGLPSPLTPSQLETMQYKKFRFLKALASATPTWAKNIGAVSTVLDNVEDGLVTIAVLGRIAAKIAPRLFERLVPGLGWVLMGSDILNAANLVSYISMASMGKKRIVEGLAEKNPFHAKAAANRAMKLKRTMPTFGEFLEIAQTTDQLFGVGLCLGGLMGVVQDAAAKTLDPGYWGNLWNILYYGNVNDVANWAAQAAMNDKNTIKKALQDQFTSLKDEAYRLKAADISLRQEIYDWTRKKSKEVWDWISAPPQKPSKVFSDTLIGSMIMSTGKDTFLKEDHTKAYMMINQAITGLMPWWIENDPLSNFKELRNFKFKAPAPHDLTTIDIMNETSPGWQDTVKWPHLDQEYATIEEIAFTYAPMIKDSFQTYAMRYSHEYEAMIAGQQVVDFTKNVIKAFSDDGDVRVGMSSYWAVAEDMMRDSYLIPPGTPQSIIDKLGDYIGEYERATGQAPAIKDVAREGDRLGINWLRTSPQNALEEAEQILPGIRDLQNQLNDLFISD